MKLLFIILILACVPQTQVGHAKSTWQTEMRELGHALSDVIPNLVSGKTSREEAADLKKKIDRIYAVSKKIDQKSSHAVKAPDSDPTLAYIGEQFRENIERARRGLQNGHVDFAKSSLKASISYCIACHTRSQTGPQFSLLEAFAEPLKQARWIDKVAFETASRQFDQVYDRVMHQLKTGAEANVTQVELDRAVRMALAISIRVKKSQEKGILLSRATIESRYPSALLKDDAQHWLYDLRRWEIEPQDYKSAEDLIRAARGLASKPDEYKTGSDVKYLRASVLMHDLLQKYPKSPYVAESLYLIGLSYDRLYDLGLWSLHEMYFEACIRKSPHSALAEKCFDRYRESIVFGYTGSRGTLLPPEVDANIQSLERLAARKTKQN